VITHVVLFKLKEPAADGEEAVRRLRSLDGNVPVLRSLSVGTDARHAERSFDIALIATFDSLEDLATYQADPFHQEVALYLRGVADRAVTVDYES
jgi:hypothetical protein